MRNQIRKFFLHIEIQIIIWLKKALERLFFNNLNHSFYLTLLGLVRKDTRQ